VLEKHPAAYVLLTNIEVNARFRAQFFERCQKEKHPTIQHFQVLGLDELEQWIKAEPELRHLYFPTLFQPPRFDLRIAYRIEPLTPDIGGSIPYNIHLGTPLFCLNIYNVGTVPSYVSAIGFEALVDGERKRYNFADFDRKFQGLTSSMNPKPSTPLEPGRRQPYFYHFEGLVEEIKRLGSSVYPISFVVEDEIENIYYEPLSEDLKLALVQGRTFGKFLW
jgi:hypothetical protein